MPHPASLANRTRRQGACGPCPPRPPVIILFFRARNLGERPGGAGGVLDISHFLDYVVLHVFSPIPTNIDVSGVNNSPVPDRNHTPS